MFRSWRTSRAAAVALVTVATFADLVAYSICVPVLPDFAHRLGASPTVIGFLFGSFASSPKPPDDDAAGERFHKTIQAKTDQGDAPGDKPGYDGGDSFENVVSDGKIGQQARSSMKR